MSCSWFTTNNGLTFSWLFFARVGQKWYFYLSQQHEIFSFFLFLSLTFNSLTVKPPVQFSPLSPHLIFNGKVKKLNKDFLASTHWHCVAIKGKYKRRIVIVVLKISSALTRWWINIPALLWIFSVILIL